MYNTILCIFARAQSLIDGKKAWLK